MIVAIVSKPEGYFVLDDAEGLVPVSKEQKEYYEAQLQNQPKSLVDKCYDFLAALGKLGPLIIAGWSLHNAKNHANHKSNLREATSNEYKANQQVLDAENALLKVQAAKLNHLLNQRGINLNPEHPDDQQNLPGLLASQPEIKESGLIHKKIAFNNKLNKNIDVQLSDLKYSENIEKTQMYLEIAKVVLHIAQNAPEIVKALNDVFVIGGDIIYTIGTNTINALKNSWKSMTTPKVKTIDTIAVEIPKVEKTKPIDFNHDEADYGNDYDNCLHDEMQPMGDFKMDPAAAAA